MNASRIFSFLVMFAVVVSSGCSNLSGIIVEKDSAPDKTIHPDDIKDAVPRHDEITRAGNKNPYTVLGKTYHLLSSSKGYYQGGVASWYGTKFHGRPTANGEIYSLYGMTAAHKTLPIPSYVKVTNLENHRTAIVRVNDRGPFHDYRIIDLSYAAAVKLGFADNGTAKVIVETVEPASFQQANEVNSSTEQYFLQVAAFRNQQAAQRLRARLLLETQQDVLVKASDVESIYRVQLGPLHSLEQVQAASERLQQLNFEQPRLITETIAAGVGQ